MRRRIPTADALTRFAHIWHYRQDRRDIPGMEAMIAPKFLALWWASWGQSYEHSNWWYTCKGVIERILQEMDLIGTPAPRPSEIAMMRAERRMEDDPPRLFRNFYRCPSCSCLWTDEWSAMRDDDCPRCGKKHISPYESEDIEDAPPQSTSP